MVEYFCDVNTLPTSYKTGKINSDICLKMKIEAHGLRWKWRRVLSDGVRNMEMGASGLRWR